MTERAFPVQDEPNPPITAAALFDRATEQRASGDFTGLLDTAARLTRDFSHKASGFNLLAQALAALGRTDDARAALERGLSLHPEDAKLQASMFRHLLKSGDLDAIRHSIDDHSRTGRKLPKAVLFDLATFQIERKDFEGAYHSGETLVAEHPEEPSSFALLAKALLCAGRASEAREVIDKGIAAHRRDSKLYNLAYHINVQLGETAAALDSASSQVRLDPTNPKAQHAVILSMLSLGRFAEAEERLAIAREAAPEFNAAKQQEYMRAYKKLKQELPALHTAWTAGLTNRPDRARATSVNGAAAMPAVAYWSQGVPPDDVMLAVAQWNLCLADVGASNVALFDRQSAADWIAEHAPEFSSAFGQAFHFAMESDIFRIAYASRQRCLYIDIDSWPVDLAHHTLSHGVSSRHSTLFFRAGTASINNSFFIAGDRCPFFDELARQCAQIDIAGLNKDYSTILDTFGPTRYNRVLEELVKADSGVIASQVSGVPGMSKLDFSDGRAVLFANEFATATQKPPFPLNYVSLGDHWKASFWESKDRRKSESIASKDEAAANRT
jgi:Flp pilus assembly protein TadD